MKPLIFGVVLACFGCQLQPDYSHDNAKSRSQQAESLEGVDATVAGLSLDDYFGPRTGWILPADSRLLAGDDEAGGVDLGGRAAAVSADGYYLTAYHVVDGIEPVMILPPGAQYTNGRKASLAAQECVLSFGRVVEHFHPHDVALVKFGHRPAKYFNSASSQFGETTAVFVAATDGYVFGPSKVGNGPFRAAGVIQSVSDEGSARVVSTSIPVRGGMSGAPCTGSDGQLIGILTGGHMSQLRHRTLASRFVAIPVATLTASIEADRRQAL